jgi:CBS domain-containing protein
MLCPSCGSANLPGADSCVRCQLPLTMLDVPAPADKVEVSLMADPVSILNPKPPVTVSADAPLEEAISCMMSHGVGALLVTDRQQSLVGILTERDFLTKIAGRAGWDGHPVREFMTANPVTVSADECLAFAVRKMDVGGYRHLPVMEQGHPTGVVSVRDVLNHVTKLCIDT